MENGRKRKSFYYAATLVCWCIIAFLTFFLTDRVNIPQVKFDGDDFKFTLRPNQLEALSCIVFDKTNLRRPGYAFSFEKMLIENNRIGPFKTTMYKKAIIQDLQFRIYKYANIIKSPVSQTNLPVLIEARKVQDTTELFEDIWKIHFLKDINLFTVCEAFVNNFEYTCYYENDLSLSIKCKKAVISYKDSNIQLRGHVIIKNQNSTLESNFVEWDFKSNTFNVNNAYTLNHNGSIKTGRNKCFDSELQEENKCTAKL